MFGQGDQEHGITAAGFSLERPADPGRDDKIGAAFKKELQTQRRQCRMGAPQKQIICLTALNPK